MPYSLEKVGKKYYVVDTSGRRYSKKPLSLAKAKKQMTALHINTGHGLTASCLKSLFTTEYEEPETPQMVTRGFTEDDDVISRTEYPSALVVPRKKKSTLKKILNYIKETDEKDFGDTFKTYKNPTYGKGKRKCKGGSYETTLPLLEKSLKEIIETMEYKLSRTPFQYLTNFLDKILKELNELIDEKGELPKLRKFGLNFIRKLHPPEPLLELMHPEALELQRELPSYIPSDDEVEQLNSDGLRLRRTVSPFLFLGPNRRIEDRRHMHGEETRKPPPSRRYTDSDIIIPESEIDKAYTRMMPEKMYMDYIRGVGPPINTDPRNVKYLVTGLIPHTAKDYWDAAPDRPPPPKEKPREKHHGRTLKYSKGKGKHTEEDTHILIGDELSGGNLYDDYIRPAIRFIVKHNLHYYAAMLAAGLLQDYLAKIVSPSYFSLFTKKGTDTTLLQSVLRYIIALNPIKYSFDQFYNDFTEEVRRQMAQQRVQGLEELTQQVYENQFPPPAIPQGTDTAIHMNEITPGMRMADVNRTARRFPHYFTPEEIDGVRIMAARNDAEALHPLTNEPIRSVTEYNANVGEGKLKFVKKYLKGQGIPATKKNVSKICNIMDVEGVVFE